MTFQPLHTPFPPPTHTLLSHICPSPLHTLWTLSPPPPTHTTALYTHTLLSHCRISGMSTLRPRSRPSARRVDMTPATTASRSPAM